MTDLCSIAKYYGTDKFTHTYTHFYDKLFKPWRNRKITMLEIGVAGGESIRMWCDFFCHPESLIYGVDIEERKIPCLDSRARLVTGDGSNPNFLFDLTNQTGPLDLVVDDGSHLSGQQKDSLRLLWPHIKPGGWFITEDCHCSFKMPWTLPDEISFVKHLDAWIDDCMEKGANDSGQPTTSEIDQIIIRKSLVAIRKR
jgi:hypothetical protein